MKSFLRLVPISFLIGLIYISGSPSTGAAATITTSNQISVATSVGFPNNVGTHFHSTLGMPVEVGSYQTGEVVYGVAEFNLAGTLPAPLTALTFMVTQFGSSYNSQTGPGSYKINVVAYAETTM